jgi:lipopolysaccharide biosynthesis protein
VIPWQVYAGGVFVILAGAFWWWLTRALRKQGATERDLADARANERMKDAQLEIAARPVSDADVRDRLRDGSF